MKEFFNFIKKSLNVSALLALAIFNAFLFGTRILEMFMISDFNYWGYQGWPWYYQNKNIFILWRLIESFLLLWSLYGMYRWRNKTVICFGMGLMGIFLYILSFYDFFR